MAARKLGHSRVGGLPVAGLSDDGATGGYGVVLQGGGGRSGVEYRWCGLCPSCSRRWLSREAGQGAHPPSQSKGADGEGMRRAHRRFLKSRPCSRPQGFEVFLASKPDSKGGGCYQIADAPRVSDRRNRWLDLRCRRDAGKAIRPVRGLAAGRRGACKNGDRRLSHGRVAQAAGGAVVAIVRATAAAVGSAALRRFDCCMVAVLSMLIVDVRVAIRHVVRHMHGRGACNHGCRAVRRRAFHGHDIACQTTQGQQHHHEQGKKTAHGLNDTGQGCLVPRRWYLCQGVLSPGASSGAGAGRWPPPAGSPPCRPARPATCWHCR